MGSLYLILGDQLSRSLKSFKNINKKSDTILLCEVMEEGTYVRHHKKKIAFIFAAMRYFAEELRSDGYLVRYIKLDDPENTGSFDGEVTRAINLLKPNKVVLTEPGEYRVLQKMKRWQKTFGTQVEIYSDNRFLCSNSDFSAWAKSKKQLRMEYFYRMMRKKYRILMETSGKPSGDKWNYDKENRKPFKQSLKPIKRIDHHKSEILKEVLALVDKKFSNHFGVLEPFHLAVTRTQALDELDNFIMYILPQFGDYQDAMVKEDPFIYHSLISSYLNVGLLLPLEVCHKAEKAYRLGRVSINSVEGFIRQVLGWREFMRGIYWHFMPQYAKLNFFNTNEPLPNFYWTSETKMLCLSKVISYTFNYAYSHHIQRLMITGNFALIAGLDVQQVQEWYLAVYSDAYEWVEMPNTLGMSLFGDGGIIASKPYAASARYINRMSNFCAQCVYSPDKIIGEKACPFNVLYWNFIALNDSKLRRNQRMHYVYSIWDKFGTIKQKAILNKAKEYKELMRKSLL